MAVNRQTKGKVGEREVAGLIRDMIADVATKIGLSPEVVSSLIEKVQRNQNQSAVGGEDLIGVFDLCIEVKRHEKEQLPAWWLQCTKSAEKSKGIPVLIFRRNFMPWQVKMPVTIWAGGVHVSTAGVVTFDEFSVWFRKYVELKLS